MNDRQSAKFQMYQKVLDVCSENEDEYVDILACVSAVNELKAQVKKIMEVSKQQAKTRPTVIPEGKNSTAVSMMKLNSKETYPLYAYAFSTGDKHLPGKVTVNKSMFYNAKNQAWLTLARIIAENANVNSQVLHDYGVGDTNMVKDAVIAELEKLIMNPFGEIVRCNSYTNSLWELFIVTDLLIYDKLDKVMKPLKISSPEFFSLYSNARNVVNTVARKRKRK
jgi:hypothetical protein